jgi:hypothetical protein
LYFSVLIVVDGVEEPVEEKKNNKKDTLVCFGTWIFSFVNFLF